MNYKDTCNLPQTDFPIRAGLAQKEQELLQKWSENNWDNQSHPTTPLNAPYILHDGPPYPNGDIHMGHALNKILKDIIVRSKTIQGHSSPYIPGWDCHGLPIETQVIKDLKTKNEEHKKTDIPWFRNRCKEFALNYVDQQRDEFKRLGIWGQWNTPYLTLTPHYESHVIRLFGEIAENGLVYKGHKPIHWCIHCETALAEAEIEYNEHRSPSIYVTFKVATPSEKLNQLLNNKPAALIVWTTTPWTLPANVAVAAHPDFTYIIADTEHGLLILAESLKDTIQTIIEFKTFTPIATLTGKDLQDTITQHPFINRPSPIVTADYVTQEDGSGFVHIAPGHGQDDYAVGKKYNLPMIMPVNSKGQFTDDVQWAGKNVFEANKDIGQLMEEKGTLLKLKFIKHSYPHCWRCKNPVIFRATAQWFIAMDVPMPDGKTLRQKALDAIDATTFYPAWGKNRIRSMIENRPDWCVSRQRYWGIPVPIFTCRKTGNSYMTGPFNEAIQKAVKKDGAQAWFTQSVQELLAHVTLPPDVSIDTLEKETDILDVWFESGASWGSVLQNTEGMTFPANLYLEGSDQHRGWFQSSLLIGLGAQNQSPFKEILTHGFIVDAKGKKMSKSQGNVIAPQKVIQEYGADILRWWVASTDAKNDVSISTEILNQARDNFSKVRNTIRFCLSNLYDFDITTQQIPNTELEELDRWALAKLHQLTEKAQIHYSEFEFHLVTYAIHDFCAVTLSALYLDMTKDRLYCDAPNSKKRRSTQTALYHILDTLLKLCAPILVFTTEDAYSYFNTPDKCQSIHFNTWPTTSQWQNSDLIKKWETLLEIKDQTYQQLEQLRNTKIIKSFLEAKVTLTLSHPISFDDWESLLIVSEVQIQQASTPAESPIPHIQTEASPHTKCDRCWKTLPTQNGLCQRCAQAIAHTST